MTNRNEILRAQISDNKEVLGAMRKSDFAFQVRQKMVEKSIKNVDLAHRIGVSEANVSRWLKGDQNLTLETMYLLADALEEHLAIVIESPPLQGRCSSGEEPEKSEVVICMPAICGKVYDFFRERDVRRSRMIKVRINSGALEDGDEYAAAVGC